MDIGGHDLFSVRSAKDADLPPSDSSAGLTGSRRRWIPALCRPPLRSHCAGLTCDALNNLFIHSYNHAEMQFFPARSLLLYGVIATMSPLTQAQTSTAPAPSQNASADARLKSAEEAFRAGSAAYLQNDLHSAHIQFAKVVQLAPKSPLVTPHSALCCLPKGMPGPL